MVSRTRETPASSRMPGVTLLLPAATGSAVQRSTAAGFALPQVLRCGALRVFKGVNGHVAVSVGGQLKVPTLRWGFSGF